MLLNKYLVRWDSFFNLVAPTYGCFLHERDNRLELHPTILGDCGGFTEVRSHNGTHKYLYLGLPAGIYQKSDLPVIESELKEWLSLLDFGSGVQYIGLGNMPSCGTLIKDNIVMHGRFYQKTSEPNVNKEYLERYLNTTKGISAPRTLISSEDANGFITVKDVKFTEEDVKTLISRKHDYPYDRSRNVPLLPFSNVKEVDQYLLSEMREPIKIEASRITGDSQASKVYKKREIQDSFFIVRLCLDDLPEPRKGYLFYVTYIRMFYRCGYHMIPHIVSKFVQQTNTSLRGTALVKAAISAADLFNMLCEYELTALESRYKKEKDYFDANKLEYVFGIKDSKVREMLVGPTLANLGDQYVADFIAKQMEIITSNEDPQQMQKESLELIFNHLVDTGYIPKELKSKSYEDVLEYTRRQKEAFYSTILNTGGTGSTIYLSTQTIMRKRKMPSVKPLYKVSIEGITEWEGDSVITVDDSKYHWWNKNTKNFYTLPYNGFGGNRSPLDIAKNRDIRIGWYPGTQFLANSSYGPIDKATVATCGQVRKMARLMEKSPVVSYSTLYDIYKGGDNAMHNAEGMIAKIDYYSNSEDFTSKFGGNNPALGKITASKMFVDSTYPLNLVPDFDGHPLERTVSLLEKVNDVVEELMVKHLTDKNTVVAVLALDKDTAVIGLINI